MQRFPTPIVVASRCLGFDACRYDGERLEAGILERLHEFVTFVPVCPELEIGLGVPRPMIRIVTTASGERLMQPESGRDLTGAMREFATNYVQTLAERGVDGFILKSRSPSCGVRDTKRFADAETDDHHAMGTGAFAAVVRERFPDLPCEDESRLEAADVRSVFLERLYLAAALREGMKSHGGELPSLDAPVPPELID